MVHPQASHVPADGARCAILAATADTFARAVPDAVLAAESALGFPSCRDVFPSLFN